MPGRREKCYIPQKEGGINNHVCPGKFKGERSQLEKIRRAYDETVDRYFAGIEDEDLLPAEFKGSERYKRLRRILESDSCGSDDPRIKDFLKPRPGMKFLDVGSGANLIRKNLHAWPSTYFGIDISRKLIAVSRKFARSRKIRVGGLYLAEAAKTPFADNFFDICAVIGVLEYYDLPYIEKALKEIHSILKPHGRIVVDMPNGEHPEITTLYEFEEYLGRPRCRVPAPVDFENKLAEFFVIKKIDRSKIMTGYFAEAGPS